eukprot:3819236-Rhodomonas_salina.9
MSEPDNAGPMHRQIETTILAGVGCSLATRLRTASTAAMNVSIATVNGAKCSLIGGNDLGRQELARRGHALLEDGPGGSARVVVAVADEDLMPHLSPAHRIAEQEQQRHLSPARQFLQPHRSPAHRTEEQNKKRRSSTARQFLKPHRRPAQRFSGQHQAEHHRLVQAEAHALVEQQAREDDAVAARQLPLRRERARQTPVHRVQVPGQVVPQTREPAPPQHLLARAHHPVDPEPALHALLPARTQSGRDAQP